MIRRYALKNVSINSIKYQTLEVEHRTVWLLVKNSHHCLRIPWVLYIKMYMKHLIVFLIKVVEVAVVLIVVL